jgi:hypothetical protein
MQDEQAIKYAEMLLDKYGTPESMANAVTELATKAMDIQKSGMSAADSISKSLAQSNLDDMLISFKKTYDTLSELWNVVSSGGATTGISTTTTQPRSDLFIPASGADTVISGPFGAFTMNPGDDILAAPNIREAAGGGGTSALVAALSKMSFHVTNVFDGDKIKSQLEIRQGQTLNNINNIA